MTKGNSLLRIKFLMVIFTIFLIAITYQLYQLQIVNGAEFRNRADLQYVGTSASNFDRGTIYIKNNIGNKFPIASVASGYRLAIHPALVTNPDKVARQIYAVLDPAEQDSVSEAEFVERFVARASRTDDSYEEILTQLSVDTGETINDLDLPGVNVYGDRWRHYPAGKLLSHVVGFISYNQDDERVGTYGLEREYESLLARGNESIFTNFFAEAFSTVQSVVNDNLSADLYLTIDRSVQIELEKTLADTAIKWHTKKTAGIVMDPKTGAIVGMAATPDFDLNTFNQVDSASIYVNPLVENVYEMGSIMKPLTMAYALDSGVVTPATHYNDTGQIKVDGFTISNYDKRARGNAPVQEILNQSLNVGTAFLVNTMGHDVFKKYFLKSGFDEVTEIDLPNEAGPLTEALLESPRRVEYVTASFGQGFAISPIAMARALSIIANGGKLPSPYIVERVQHELGTWDDMRQDQKQTQVISAAAAKTTTDMLVTVVDEALAGGDESLRNYSIAAKTGTAQIANQSGSYREDAYLHTFFGFFPAHNPRYLIFLLNEEPRGARYASETLTDPFMSLTKFLINYQNLEPDR